VAISTLHRGFDAGAFLPDDLAAALRRRVREIGGLALIGLAAVGTAALATWSVKDPSLSYATGGAVHNLLGTWGAVGADLLMQLFGIAAIAIVLPVALWGWRLFTHRRLDRMRLRLGLWIAGAPLAAGFIACLMRPHTWPLPTGLGGVIGDTLLRLPAYVAGGVLSGTPRLVIALLLGLAAFLVIVTACGVGFHAPIDDDDYAEEEEAEDHEGEGIIAIALGALGHELLSLRAHAARGLAALLSFRKAEPSARTARKRLEPRIVPRAEGKEAEAEAEAETEAEA
jgi:DNA segregation ATPase FtsK/SpoIIIE, S-DNA-T family